MRVEAHAGAAARPTPAEPLVPAACGIQPAAFQAAAAQPVSRRDVTAPRRAATVARGWLWLAACCSGLWLTGCNPPPRPEFQEISRSSSDAATLQPPVEDLPDTAPARKPFSEPWETWQAYYIAGQHVGYSHVRAEPQSDEADAPIQITLADQLLLRRGASEIVQRLDQTSLETRAGELLSFEAQLRIGPVLTTFAGAVEDDMLTILTTRGAATTTRRLPWDARYRGLAGLQQSLLSDPIAPGQQRRLRALMPIQLSIATIELDCQHTASIAMPDGSVQPGYESVVAMEAEDGQRTETMVWTDPHGKVIKSYTPALQLVAYDATAQTATQGQAPREQLLRATALRVRGQLSEPQRAWRVGYAVVPRQQDAEAAPRFVGGPGQWVRQAADGSFQLLVSRDPEEKAGEGFVTDALEPEREDLRAGPLIDSNHALVKQLAATAVGKQDQPHRLALDLTRAVTTMTRVTAGGEGFRRASEVAREGSGDSTGQAVLLAALLRARGIPARVAVGLVYDPGADAETAEQPRMSYHMWTLAHLEGRWVHLDATLGGEAPAERILLGSHHLADGNGYASVVPVIGAIGRFDIEVLNAQVRPE